MKFPTGLPAITFPSPRAAASAGLPTQLTKPTAIGIAAILSIRTIMRMCDLPSRRSSEARWRDNERAAVAEAANLEDADLGSRKRLCETGRDRQHRRFIATMVSGFGVSRRSEAAQCCALDEGRSLGAALQEEASNHHERLPHNGGGRERHG
jgi:hypothetical protein